MDVKCAATLSSLCIMIEECRRPFIKTMRMTIGKFGCCKVMLLFCENMIHSDANLVGKKEKVISKACLSGTIGTTCYISFLATKGMLLVFLLPRYSHQKMKGEKCGGHYVQLKDYTNVLRACRKPPFISFY